jgi:hypothetical protein
LQIRQTLLVQHDSDYVKITFDDREIRNVLKYQERVDQVATPGVISDTLQKILRSGYGGKCNILDTSVVRKRGGSLNHAARDVHPNNHLEVSSERKRQTTNATSHFQANQGQHFVGKNDWE